MNVIVILYSADISPRGAHSVTPLSARVRPFGEDATHTNATVAKLQFI
jgi:hypothetical protein